MVLISRPEHSMGISDLVRQRMAEGSFIRKMFEEGIALKKVYGNDQVFDLTIGNPIFEPPEQFNREMRKLVEKPLPGMHRYMENAGYTETREAISAYLKKESGLDFKAADIVMTVGTAGALNAVLKALLNPGEEVITFAPYFFEYAVYVDNHGGQLKVLPSDPNFVPDFAAFETSINEKTKAVIINSPNNPTGTVYGREVLATISQILERKSAQRKQPIFVITDDVYAKIYYGEGRCPRILDSYANTIVVTSFSKDLALPGERIGYAAVHPACAGAAEVVNAIIYGNRVLGFVNAPALMQVVVRRLLETSVSIAEYRRKRDLLCNGLTKLGYSLVIPLGAFYIFPRCPAGDDLAFINELKEMRVLVVPGTPFKAPGYFRISYCLDDRTLEGSLAGFGDLAEKYHLKARS
jgi:aspartate aminotransferase